MSDKIPESDAVKALLDEEDFSVWEKLCAVIEAEYEMKQLWKKKSFLFLPYILSIERTVRLSVDQMAELFQRDTQKSRQ